MKEPKTLTGKRITAELKQKGWTRSQLGLYTNINKTTISKCLSGERELPEWHAAAIAQRFGVRTEWILGKDDFRTEEELIAHRDGVESLKRILKIDTKKAYNAIFSDLGFLERVEHGIKVSGKSVTISRFEYDGKEYFVDSNQKEKLIEALRPLIRDYLLGGLSILADGNIGLKELYEKRLSEYPPLDRRPAAEIIAMAEEIRKITGTPKAES